MENKRNKGLYIKFTQEELDDIQDRMLDCNIKNRSAYIRKMIFRGLIINLDLTELTEVTRILNITSNNINQLAKVAHCTGHIYKEDVIAVKTTLDGIKLQFGEILKHLSKIGG